MCTDTCRYYLVELAITAIKYKLNGNVGSVLETAETGGREVNGETERTLSLHLEVGDGLAKVRKAGRVTRGRQQHSH